MVALYHSLPPRHIRLLEFLDDSGTLCSLRDYPSIEAPSYVALSYAWAGNGEASTLKATEPHIEVNGHAIPVRYNLHAAFTCLASVVRDRGHRLWVDAICINQSDLSERSQQVQLMKLLYENAHSVFSWLGSPDHHTELAVELMQLIRWFHSDMRRNWRLLLPHQIASLLSEHPMLDEQRRDLTTNACKEVQILLSKRYWGRTWVHQEVTLPHVVFYCGTSSFGWTHILAVRSLAYYASYAEHRGMPEHLFGLAKRYITFNPAVSELCTAYYNRSALLRQNRAQMSQALPLIRQLRPTDCADARDKVFAALPHALDLSEQERQVIMASGYTKTVAQVYLAVAELALQSDDDLEFLGYVCRPSPGAAVFVPPKGESELPWPSWLPDWRLQTSLRPLNCTGYLNASYDIIYKPCPGTTNLDARIVGNQLHVRGFLFDTIVAVTSTAGADMDRLQDVQHSWQTELDQAGAWYDEGMFDRTVVADAHCFRNEAVQRSVNSRGFSIDWDLLSKDHHTLSSHSASARQQMWDALSTVCLQRRAGWTENGCIGIFPADAGQDDLVAAIHGGNALYVLRPSAGSSGGYGFVGECYVDGMMDGQAVRFAREHGIKASMIVVV